MQFFAAAATLELLDLRRLMAALGQVLGEYRREEIDSPQRLAVPCGPDRAGTLLSMPCRAPDILIHKLLTVYGGNAAAGRPAIQGQVTALDAGTGTPLFTLDGPAVTARRTAAISMLALTHLRSHPPATVAVIGTGAQAEAHVEAVRQLHPAAAITVRGTSGAKEAAFAARFTPAGARVRPHPAGPVRADVVIAATGSRTPVYDEPAEVGRLVIGVGAFRLDMAELGARAFAGSQVYVDDPVGAPAEAGDVVAAGVDWSEVRPLADAIVTRPDFSRPIVFKSVGCAVWDLAACRVAREALGL